MVYTMIKTACGHTLWTLISDIRDYLEHLKKIHPSTYPFVHPFVNMSIHPSANQKIFAKHLLCVPSTAVDTMAAAARGKFRIGCSQVTQRYSEMAIYQQSVDSGSCKLWYLLGWVWIKLWNKRETEYLDSGHWLNSRKRCVHREQDIINYWFPLGRLGHVT